MKKLTVLSAALLLSACGGASAELRLMDAPPQGVTSVKIHVASMQVHVDDKDKAKDADPADSSIDADGKWQTLAVDKQIDLVAHQGEAAANVLGQLDLPEGKITQIRLVIDLAKPNVATFNGVDCNLDMSKIEAKGIKINHAFKALDPDGGEAQVWVDFKLDEAMTAKGDCFLLEPKIKLHKVKVDGGDVQF